MSEKYPVRRSPLKPHPNDKFVPLFDNSTQQWYLARVAADGSLSPRARAHSGMANLTAEQYALIAWCIWRKYNGWSLREIGQIVRQFWRNEPGQPPWSQSSLGQWWRIHLAMKKAGRSWPG